MKLDKFINDLNLFIDDLDIEYNVNCGGCAFLAYTIANNLYKRNIKYQVCFSYDHKPFGEPLQKSCCHLFLKVKKRDINIVDYYAVGYKLELTPTQMYRYYRKILHNPEGDSWAAWYKPEHNHAISIAMGKFFNEHFV